MTLETFVGNPPSNVNTDAKYHVTADGQVRLVYRIDARTRELLTTSAHPDLVKIVNEAKRQLQGGSGGVFYINEYSDVLIPDGAGGAYWAGSYDGTLEFAFEDGVLGPKAPEDLEPGHRWPGPHPGVAHTLRAGGADIKYERRVGMRTTEVRLSDEVGDSRARETAHMIAAVKGTSGGRFYINERRELFGPVAGNDYAHFVYIGSLDESPWFDAPGNYDRL